MIEIGSLWVSKKDGRTVRIVGYADYWPKVRLERRDVPVPIDSRFEMFTDDFESEYVPAFAVNSKLPNASDSKDDDDNVNHPSHYNHGGVETIDLIKCQLTPEEYRGYLKGNILKYRDRHPYKGKAEEDLAKAKWYYDKLMEES